MIKTWLRHIILEVCVGITFDELKKNFPTVIDTSKLFIGEYINVRILVGNSHYVLQGCRVDSQDGDLTYLKYEGFDSPIILVTKDGELVDIKGSYDDITEHFI